MFISTSRADYGLLKDVIIETQKLNKDTFLLISGSHLSKEFGKTISEIKKDKIKNIIQKKILDKKFKDTDISNYLIKSIKITRDVIKKLKPDVLIILGDRYEMLGCAIAAMVFRIPIAHIHGGEITKGALDDSIRHSITKFSNLHFPIHEQYRKRLIQLGENPKSIFNFGGLGAHAISKTRILKKKELGKKLKINFNKKIVLVTFHPVTLEKNESKNQIQNLIKFLYTLNDYIIILTSPNFDNEAHIVKKSFLSSLEKEKITIILT